MPTLFVIAGPNGIGKTTSSYDVVPKNTPVINSDEIAKEARIAGLLAVNAQEYSNREAMRLIEEQTKDRNSFAIETNLADVDTWKFLLEMQKTGYKIHLKFFSTDDIHILNERISERYRQGEHFVKPDVVMERYVNGLNLLNHYFNRPDILELFDNTKKMVRLAEISQGQIIEVIESLPNWVTQYLGQHFQQQIEKQKQARDLGSIEEVRKSYEDLKAKADSLLQKKDQSQDDLNEQKKNTNRQKPRGL
jgi:predicted ABC-type ATPase